jgi:hypothetical protein
MTESAALKNWQTYWGLTSEASFSEVWTVNSVNFKTLESGVYKQKGQMSNLKGKTGDQT